jgi:START domain
MQKLILLVFMLCASTVIVHAQANWELKKEGDGIKVYNRSVPDSRIKVIKVTCLLDASLSQLTALLLDVNAHEKWVYNSKTSSIVKQIKPNQIIYYSEIDMPGTIANRDVVVEMTITQNHATKVMTVRAYSVDQYIPVMKNKVRIPLSKVDWTITPIEKKKLSVEYVAQADPGGDIPAWLVNTFSTKGPFETFKNLKELVTSPAYQFARYDFIKD